jgi:FkbM family methyltransferase
MEIFYSEINQKTKIEPKNILEIGSRDGHDSETLRKLFNLQNSQVWVVEPNPEQINYIKTAYPEFNIVPHAIFTEECEHDFYQVNGSMDDVGTSSLFGRNDEWYDNKSNKIKVKTITGVQLLDKINSDIDICKLDVEGLTYEVLISFKNNLNRIKSFHIECEHTEIWEGQKLYDSVSDLLKNNGYTQIYFNHCSGGVTQSDSIWVLNEYLK